MQLKRLHFGFMVRFFMHLRAGESNQQLLDFVVQIKASHLNQCREIVAVFVEPLPIASTVIRLNTAMVPVLTVDGNWDTVLLEASCGIVFTSLFKELVCVANNGCIKLIYQILASTFQRQLQNVFSSKAKLLFIVDVKQRSAHSLVSAKLFLTTKLATWLSNTVLVSFNESAAAGYYFEPISRKIKELNNSSHTIYPTVQALNDLQKYELHFVFIPSVSDQAVIETMVRSLSIDRNGTLKKPIGLEPATLLNLSTTYKWHFTMLTIGPLEYATCFIVPRAGLVPIWYILVAPFDTATWLGILTTGMVIVILLKLYGKSSLLGSAIMLLQSVFTSPNRIARTHFERRILTACMLGCLVLVSSYQSIIYSLISNPIFYAELDTEQLINSSCAIYMLNELEGINTFRDMFVDRAKFKTGVSCLCASCQMKYIMRNHTDLFWQYRISRHRTHPFPMLIALVDRDYQPLNELVRFYVSSFLEAGLTTKMLRDGQAKDDKQGYTSSKLSQEYTSLQLQVSDLQIVWLVLELGLASASLCFIGELIWNCTTKTQKMLWKRRTLKENAHKKLRKKREAKN